MAQVMFFGDSITYGMWDSHGGWVARLRADIDSLVIKSKYLKWQEVFNLGVSGDFTKDVLKRIKTELPDRLRINKDCLVIIGVGINDTKYGEGSSESTPELYRKQLNQICQHVRKYTKQIMFLGLTTVDEEVFGQERWIKDKGAFSNQRIKEFDEVLLEVCNQQQAAYVPLYYDFISRGKKLLADGIHPNDRGHELIYKTVKPFVWQQLNF